MPYGAEAAAARYQASARRPLTQDTKTNIDSPAPQTSKPVMPAAPQTRPNNTAAAQTSSLSLKDVLKQLAPPPARPAPIPPPRSTPVAIPTQSGSGYYHSHFRGSAARHMMSTLQAEIAELRAISTRLKAISQQATLEQDDIAPAEQLKQRADELHKSISDETTQLARSPYGSPAAASSPQKTGADALIREINALYSEITEKAAPQTLRP